MCETALPEQTSSQREKESDLGLAELEKFLRPLLLLSLLTHQIHEWPYVPTPFFCDLLFLVVALQRTAGLVVVC